MECGCSALHSQPQVFLLRLARTASPRLRRRTHNATTALSWSRSTPKRSWRLSVRRAAFERYMAPDFIEHKPDIPRGTRDATASFLEDVIAEVPQARWEIIRTIAEGDLVFLHVRFTPAEGAPAYALADIFRVEHCRIVEHWDVVAGPIEGAVNPNSRF
jgi:predicted SnoaL-like aldol condensation-catalyzing enzyme